MNTWIKNLKIEKKHFLMVIAFIFAGFQIYTTILGSMPEIKQRAAHLGFHHIRSVRKRRKIRL